MKITREGHWIHLTEGGRTIYSQCVGHHSVEANLMFAILEKLEEIRYQNIDTRNHICGALLRNTNQPENE